MSDFHNRAACRLCGSTRLEELLRFPDTALANEYPREPNPAQDRFPLYLVGCGACGHVQLPVVVKAERLFPADYPYQSGTSAVFRKHLQDFADQLMCLLDPADMDGGTHKRHLDVACNDGTLVDMVRSHNRLSFGIDPAAPEEVGFHRGFFTEAWAKAELAGLGSVDIITALNVFAHVDDLDDFTRGVKALLEHDGLFIFEVGYLPDVVRRGLFDVVYHEHLSYHHLSPLVPFFKRHGMALVDAHRIDSQGGSIRCFVRNCESHQAMSARLHELLAEEAMPARGGRTVADLKPLAERYVGDGLRGLHKRCGGDVAYYGAPAKLTTLLAATNAPKPLFVVDDNPLKVGRYVPGTSVPILPVSALYERKPRGVVCSSWNFAEDIQRRHAELGCEWHVPLPAEGVRFSDGVWVRQ